MVNQNMHCSNKKVSKALRHKLFEWILKYLNVREFSIAPDTLLIVDTESGLKQRVPKNLTGMFHATVAQSAHCFTR